MKNLTNYITEKLIIGKQSLEQNKDSKVDPNDASSYAVGDILCGSYCYSMTLPRFYKIIKATAKTYTCIRIPGKIVSGHHNGQWEEIPDESQIDKYKDNPIRARINKHNRLVIDGIYLRLWDGKPLHGDDMD